MKGVPGTALLLAVVGLAAAAGAAQRPFQLGAPPRPNGPQFDAAGNFATYDGAFHFCRLWFRNGFEGDGDGWYVDYPRADENLSIRLAELTKVPVTNDLEGNPDHYVIRL